MGRRYNQQSTFLSDDLDHDMHLQGGLFITEDDNAEEHLLMFALEQFTAVEDLAKFGEIRHFSLHNFPYHTKQKYFDILTVELANN